MVTIHNNYYFAVPIGLNLMINISLYYHCDDKISTQASFFPDPDIWKNKAGAGDCGPKVLKTGCFYDKGAPKKVEKLKTGCVY